MSLAGFARMDDVYADVRNSQSFPTAQSLPHVQPQKPARRRHRRKTPPPQPQQPMQMLMYQDKDRDTFYWIAILILVTIIFILFCSLMKAVSVNNQLSNILLNHLAYTGVVARPGYLAGM